VSGEIYAALAKCMAEVGHIGKERKNQAQGYQFRGIDDVMAHCQSVLATNGVVVVAEVLEREREILTTQKGGTMASVRLLVAHTFFAKDGSFVVATTLGEAMDSGDKASNKAMSAALKYALTETLMIPTYEADRDTEEASPELASKAKPKPIAPKIQPLPADEVDREVSLILMAGEGAQTGAELDVLIPRVQRLPKPDRDTVVAALKIQRERIGKVKP
jgi:hypothetical protein